MRPIRLAHAPAVPGKANDSASRRTIVSVRQRWSRTMVDLTGSTDHPAFIPGKSMFLDAVQGTSVAPFLSGCF